MFHYAGQIIESKPFKKMVEISTLISKDPIKYWGEGRKNKRVAYGRIRVGKTFKDKKSGKWLRNKQNIALRGIWSHEGGNFPAFTCRGKGNSNKAIKY
ncbi:MAG: hypothetical protein ACREBU_05625 [Nitrososphaera sp.]